MTALTLNFESFWMQISNGPNTLQKIKSKAPLSQLVNADDTSVIEIKTQLYLES